MTVTCCKLARFVQLHSLSCPQCLAPSGKVCRMLGASPWHTPRQAAIWGAAISCQVLQQRKLVFHRFYFR